MSQLTGDGTAANFNISQGEKKDENAKHYVGNGLFLSVLLGILYCMLLLVFKTPILVLCGASGNVLSYAQAYLEIIALGVPFHIFTSACSFLIRADRSPRYTMLCSLTGTFLNVILDGLFMLVFHWGIRGAALATIISQIVSFLICVAYLPKFRSFRIKLYMLSPSKQYLFRIIKLGTSNFINQTVMMIVNIVMNNQLVHYGALSAYGSDIPLAISGIIAKLNSILSAFSVGLAQGSQPILSYNRGAKNYDRIKRTYKTAAVSALAVSFIAFFDFYVLPRQVISIFGGGTEEYYIFGIRYLRIYMMLVCVFGLQPLTVHFFSSIGEVRKGIFLSFARQGFILLPLLIILPLFFGLDGILYSGAISDGLAFLLSITMVSITFRKFSKTQL